VSAGNACFGITRKKALIFAFRCDLNNRPYFGSLVLTLKAFILNLVKIPRIHTETKMTFLYTEIPINQT
jgi:hypothetical protein